MVIIKLIRRFLVSVSLLLATTCVQAQEVLLPLQAYPRDYSPAKAADTQWVQLPFFDDFANYEGVPNQRLWMGGQAYVNKDYAPLPPTLGMVTLDAINAQGTLYPQASSSRFSADTLASQPIRLDSLLSPSKRGLTPADSIYLSFFYCPGGGTGDPWERMGDCPDETDSLILEFYNPTAKRWNMVWATGGVECVDSLIARTGTAWQYVSVAVAEPDYFNRNFRFRFRNYCSLDDNPKPGMVGNTDQWNLDYIYLSHGRRKGERNYRDVAFVEKAPSMLKYYQAMPARQFQARDMANNIELTITNLYSQPLATNYYYNVYAQNGSRVAHYDGGHENTPSYWTNHAYQTEHAHATPQVNFTYPTTGNKEVYTIEHVLTEGTSGDIHKGNDTLRFEQKLTNYYAYDDGVPENGYGISSTSSKLWIACRYDIHVEDTLSAVDFYFNPTRNNENTSVKFYLCVWSNNNGAPGSILYKDPVKSSISPGDIGSFHRYKLENALVVSDTVFIGFEQIGSTYINLGFDRDHDARDFTYYRVSNQWQQSILKGALMMRPCFGKSALTAIEEPEQENLFSLNIYPNPSNGQATIRIDSEMKNLQVSLFDARGRLILHQPYTDEIQLDNLTAGLYLIRVVAPTTGNYSTKKLIVK